ncbi:MAG: hypothetical protein C0513_02555 [Isosphaera sp.]|nr:hypothetical protein [Isosphaera sp.]
MPPPLAPHPPLAPLAALASRTPPLSGPRRSGRSRARCWLGVLLAGALAGCAQRRNLSEPRGPLDNLPGATRGGQPTTPRARPGVPTEAQLVRPRPDGTEHLLCAAPVHLIFHTRRFLSDPERFGPDFLAQIVSDRTKSELRARGRPEADALEYLVSNADRVGPLLASLSAGEASSGAIFERTEEKTYLLRTTARLRTDGELTNVWMSLRGRQWELLWID